MPSQPNYDDNNQYYVKVDNSLNKQGFSRFPLSFQTVGPIEPTVYTVNADRDVPVDSYVHGTISIAQGKTVNIQPNVTLSDYNLFNLAEKPVCLLSGVPANVTSGNPIIWPSVTKDSHGKYSITTGQYTVPVTGIYRATAVINSNLANTAVNFYRNAVSYTILGYFAGTGLFQGSGLAYYQAGDLLDIRPGGNLTAWGAAATQFACIEFVQ